MSSYFSVTDLFCGAGGSSTGLAGLRQVEIHTAANHWRLALESHAANHPKTRHLFGDLRLTHPSEMPRTTMLWASPECFPAGTLILAARGLIPIEKVRIGDHVLTHANRWMPVTATMQTQKDTVIVKGQGHYGLETTAEHPFYVRSQGRKWNQQTRRDVRTFADPEWIKAEGLADQKYRWATPTSPAALDVPKVPGRGFDFTPDFWWMIGRWLGDGSLRIRPESGSELTICCGRNEYDELNDKLSVLYPQHDGRSERNELRWRSREVRTGYLFEAAHTGLCHWLVEHFGKMAHGKTVPAWALTMDTQWREALLEGYLSADGHRNHRRTRADSVSKRLALGIKLLAETLGYRASFGLYDRIENQIEGRTIEAYSMYMAAWENNHSERTAFEDDGHAWSLIKSVEPGNQNVTVYNLSVAEDESYVADGIVVHNCTNHSLAKGKKRKNLSQRTLWGDDNVDPNEERSRATMREVVEFAEYHRYPLIIVENVTEIRMWVHYRDWIIAMHNLGYEHKEVFLNSMHAHPTPQSRDRIYVCFWLKGNKAPDLDIQPRAFCPKCGCDVDSVWARNRGKSKKEKALPGRVQYGKQYFYVCPRCVTVVTPYYHAAANIIDWSLPAERIGDRKKALAANTMRRIEKGLKKYKGQHLIVDVEKGNQVRGAYSTLQPLPTQTASQKFALFQMPFIVSAYGRDSAHSPVTQQMPTITGFNNQQALCIPPGMIVTANKGTLPRGVEEPLSAITAGGGHHWLLTPPGMIITNMGTAVPHGLDEPLSTVMAEGTKQWLLTMPFLTPYYGNDGAMPVTDAVGAITTKDRYGLVQPTEDWKVEDCGYRMLTTDELRGAMGFPEGYILLGNKEEMTEQLGNAVTPPVSRELGRRMFESLT